MKVRGEGHVANPNSEGEQAPGFLRTAITVLLASNNAHKAVEFRDVLSKSAIRVVTPSEAGIELDVAEEGPTFRDNARAKALGFSRATDMPVAADDSGLEVDGLGGLPGVHSRRFGGANSDGERNEKLLALLQSASGSARSARFVCALAVAEHGRLIFETECTCEGTIAESPRGSHGFGYDPVFVPRGYDRTFSELGPEVKNRISHRAKAIAKLAEFFAGGLGGQPFEEGVGD